jgi:hypothetical protein
MALLGALTAIASLILIVGTFLIWGAVNFWPLIHGQIWQAAGLFACGRF